MKKQRKKVLNRNIADSPLIRSLDFLDLDEETRIIADSLLEQIDMPFVFWMDSEIGINAGGRHPEENNEYWITIRPQVDKAEKKRLILGGMYRAIQEKNRYWRIVCDESDVNKVKLVAELNSLVTSLDIEWFLKQYNISTASYWIDAALKKETKLLKRYINFLKSKQYNPDCKWSKEKEIYHIIQCGNLCRRSTEIREKLEKLTAQLNDNFVNEMRYVAALILEKEKEYDGNNGNRLTKEFLDRIITKFELSKEFHMCRYDHFQGIYPIGETMAPVFSYIPKELDDQKELILWLRTARAFICYYRSSQGYNVPEVLINLIDSSTRNTYADGNEQDGFCISYTTGLLKVILDLIDGWPLSENSLFLLDEYGESECRKHLFRMTAYFITAHEYAHILAGDCNNHGDCLTEDELLLKEKNADQKAEEMIVPAIMNEHRFRPAPSGEHKRVLEAYMRGGKTAMLQTVSLQRMLEINDEVYEHKRKIYRDIVLLEDVRLLVEKLRQDDFL